MPGSVAWQWKADAYPRQIGSSICRSSPQEAFDERCHTLPRNSVECDKFHTPSNLVVAHWSADVESNAPFDFLLRHAL